MSEYIVTKLSEEFVKEWGPLLQVSPSLELDGSWPSVAVLDLLTYSLRTIKDPPVALLNLRKGCAAYLATFIRTAWTELIEEIKIFDGPNGIEIIAKGGLWIPEGESVQFPLEKVLAETLLQLPFPFRVTRHFQKPIHFDSSIVSDLALSVLTGLHPALDGAWSDATEKQLADFIREVEKHLAKSTAAWYEARFPQEPLGQSAELYLNRLIFPMTMMNEPVPLLGVGATLALYAEELKLPTAMLRTLGQNLCSSPDELLANTGLVLYLATVEGEPDPKVVSLTNSRGNLMGMLRRAVVDMRIHLKLGKDWIERGVKSEDDEHRFLIDQTCNLLPWNFLSLDRLKQDKRLLKLKPLLQAIRDFSLVEATEICDKLLEHAMSDLDLRLQRIKLEMVRGDLERADSMFHSLFTEPGADESYRYFGLWGMCSLGREDSLGAQRNFKAALALPGIPDAAKADLLNNLAWSHMIKGEFGPALEALDRALLTATQPVTILLNKASILWELQRYNEVQTIRRTLFSIAPTDRRVFSSLALTEGIVSSLKQ